MKKNLRLLCLGLATAATFSAGFAQTNVTHKLRNADMELGIKGWGVDGESHLFGRNKKYQSSRRGFHGMNLGVLENWRGDKNGLGDNSISQTVKNLPNGTYVFGAYIAASLQGTDESNRESIEGVTLFANDANVAVATDNPDNSAAKWAHSAKFNVATTVIDGTLNVGLNVASTNANYVVWDNATLYYFGNMDEAAALDAMAKIDMAATIAIADTCFAYKMNVDSLALLNEAKAAAKTLATADQLWQLDEDLYWAIFKATRSLGDYRSFNNAIAAAEVIAEGEWSPSVMGLDELNAAIIAAKSTYEEATADRPALNEQKAALNEAAALVYLDSCYLVADELDMIIEELPNGDEVGEYSDQKIEAIRSLLDEMRNALDAAAYSDELTAVEARQEYNRLYAKVQNILDNPNAVDSFPFTVGEADGTVATKVDGRFEFTSKVYTVAYPVTNLRFTFLESYNENGAACLDSGKYPQIALAEFYLYDGEGNQVDLDVDNFSTNAQEPNEGPMANICDGDKTNFWHSKWSSNVGTWHYLEITLPEGLDLTTFSFGWVSRYTAQVVPKTVEVSSVTTAATDLDAAIAAAKTLHPYTGTEPGFYKEDVSSFWSALAAAEALVGTDASDDEIYEAIVELEDAQAMIDELKVIMPEAGKKYRFVSADVRFFEKQGVQKALTVRNDTLWWETANAENLQQEFILEAIPNNEGRYYYTMKNVETGLYVNSGDEGDYHPLLATPDTVELFALGAGQFGLQAHSTGVFHACDHNSGSLGAGWNGNLEGAAGGLFGDYSGVIPYGEPGLDGDSEWYIREMFTLPHATKSLSDLNFQSEAIHLYEGVNTLTLTADKGCSFAGLKVYGKRGEEILGSVSVSGANATVVLDTTVVESFSFSFANSEGVETVTVNASVSKLYLLQAAYDAAVAVAPVPGTGIMQYKDLVAYNSALANAAKLLAYGASDEAVEDAIAKLEAAVAGLTPNYPEENKTYFIVNALEAFEENHGVKMMLYANDEGTPRWMYENVDNSNRLWRFEAAEVEEGAPAAFYIMNEATGTYFGDGTDALVERGQAAAYKITQLEGTIIALDKADDNQRIHANGHGSGSGKTGNIVYWGSGLGTASAWTICESEEYIELTDIDFTELESDEQIAPAQKGTYDLFGRRIVAPAAAGIYIVDGKKKVVK